MTDERLDIKTYSLTEVAEMVLPPDMTNGVRWLSNWLNRGELSGYRVGRTWRMTRADVEDLINRHRNRALPQVEVTARRPDFFGGLTPTSRRRLGRGDS
jgi:excisionase family DNA binding protein